MGKLDKLKVEKVSFIWKWDSGRQIFVYALSSEAVSFSGAIKGLKVRRYF